MNKYNHFPKSKFPYWNVYYQYEILILKVDEVSYYTF